LELLETFDSTAIRQSFCHSFDSHAVLVVSGGVIKISLVWPQIFSDARRFKNKWTPSLSAKKQADFFYQLALHYTFCFQADLK